nr:pyridoxal-dependent decarboxylase, exosortase A system-associated [Halorhodospira halophila]
MEVFSIQDGELTLQGVPVTQLAESAGQTPFFAYDRAMIDHRVAALRATLPPEIHLHYAIKANPMPELVQHLARMVDGLDVASAGELALALETETAPADISIAGPGKQDHELARALESGVTINLESPGELERLAELANRHGRTPSVAIRINPDFTLKTSGMQMGGGPKQFGIDTEQAPAVLHRIGELSFDFRGFQIFAGSQNLNTDALITAQNGIFELFNRLADEAPAPVTLLNMGGGLGIPYFANDRPLDLDRYGEHLHRHVAACRQRFPNVQIVLELGRYLVGEAGVYVVRVIDRKVSRGQVFLVTDGGMHHHLAASGNLGQTIRRDYPIALATAMDHPAAEDVSVVGPLCTPLDVLGSRVPLPYAKPGDLIVVFQSGAYGLSASPTYFLNHPKAAELLV